MYIPAAICDLVGESRDYVTIAYSIILVLLFIKLCFYLRIFDGFSFLVSMFAGVFMDLRYFLAFYSFVLILFGLIFTLLST